MTLTITSGDSDRLELRRERRRFCWTCIAPILAWALLCWLVVSLWNAWGP